MPREELALMAETVKRVLDSGGDRSAVKDRDKLLAALERVKAHSDGRPDRIDRRTINQRLRQYARSDRDGLFCDTNRGMKAHIQITIQTEVGQHVQEIACWERKEHHFGGHERAFPGRVRRPGACKAANVFKLPALFGQTHRRWQYSG